MIDRAGIEAIVRATYAARVRGDVDGTVHHFDQNATFRLVGDTAASPVPGVAAGAPKFRAHLAELIKAFTFHSYDIVDMVVEGSKAAVRTRIRVTSTMTGQTAETETADFIEVKDGRIVSFVQYCDTALAAKLATK